MSNGPTPGNQIPPIIIPRGSIVYYSGMVQAAWQQFVQLKDSSGNVIFTMTGSSPDYHTPTSIGDGSFTANDPNNSYTITIGVNNSASGSKVLWEEDVINLGPTIYLSRYTFLAEDGNDQDFNDSYVSLHWFLYYGVAEEGTSKGESGTSAGRGR